METGTVHKSVSLAATQRRSVLIFNPYGQKINLTQLNEHSLETVYCNRYRRTKPRVPQTFAPVKTRR
jgi:hypothetical protein